MTWTRQGTRDRTSTTDHRNRRQRVFARDNHTCQIRGPRCNGRAEHLDHIDNTRGPHYETDANTQAACQPCNQWKASREGNQAAARNRARLRLPEEPHPGAGTGRRSPR